MAFIQQFYQHLLLASSNKQQQIMIFFVHLMIYFAPPTQIDPQLVLNCCQATYKHTRWLITLTVIRTPVKRSDTCIVKSPSSVIFYISIHGMPLVQSNYLVGTYNKKDKTFKKKS